jgi:hypothetical protein
MDYESDDQDLEQEATPNDYNAEDMFPIIKDIPDDEDNEADSGTSQILGSKERLDVSSFSESDTSELRLEDSKSFTKHTVDLTEEDSLREHAYNYFIFTLAGKPIFCRFGDEFHLSPMFATFSALIPKILSFYCDNAFYKDRNFLRCIRAKNIKCVVLIKSQI